MATLPDLQDATRRVWEIICAESAPGDFVMNRDLANDAAISLIVEGGFDSSDSDVVLGGDMSDVCQTLLAAAFMLQPQLATRVLNLPDPDADQEDILGMSPREYAAMASPELTPIQQAVQEHFESLGRVEADDADEPSDLRHVVPMDAAGDENGTDYLPEDVV